MYCNTMVTKKFLTGTRFGNLVIVSWDKNHPGGKYKCRCDCGRITFFTSWHLKHGSKSCLTCRGRYSRTLSVGQKFGQLTVMKWIPRKKIWLCKCTCGRMTNSRTWSLKNGKHQRCKECGRHRDRITARLPNDLGIKRDMYRLYKSSAKRRDYVFHLTEERFFKLIALPCVYCGGEPMDRPDYYRKGRMMKANGIDRVNNSKGYTKANCVSCCDICNNSKSILSVKQWKEWIKQVHKHITGGYKQ